MTERQRLNGAWVAVAIAALSSATNAALGWYVVRGSTCLNDTCTAVSQRCAAANPPVECSWCSGDTKKWFCGWAPAEFSCEAKDGPPTVCGYKFTGALCQDHICSGGTGDPNTPCALNECRISVPIP